MNKKILLSVILSCSLWANLSLAEDYSLLSPASENDSLGYVSKYLSESLSSISKENFDVQYINYGSPQEAYKQAFNTPAKDASQKLTLILSPRFLSLIISHRALYNLESFYYYSSIFSSQYVIITQNDGYINKFADIKNFCKKYPLNVSLSGIGDVGYLALMKLNKRFNCEIQYIPDRRYKKQINEVKSPNANIGILPLYEVLPILKDQNDPYIKTNIIPLAILGDQKVDQLPNTPTTKDLGFDDLYATSSIYVAGLANVPKSQSDIMQSYINKALKDPTFISNMKALGITVNTSSHEQVYNELKGQMQKIRTYYNLQPW